MEVPFCGHATIALGAALGERFGEGTYNLTLNDSEISVRASKSDLGFSATLQSPSTWSKDAPEEWTNRVLAAFQLKKERLDDRFPVRIAGAGATHLIIFVKDRQTLADMKYPFEEVRALMAEQNLVTISLLWQESDSVIHSRNPFAAGGVYEDPATGAAAAALAGYLRDIGWTGSKTFTILQGEDMGVPSRLNVSFTDKSGESISVSGEVRHIE
jgi:PhzF family phenazine biosynthesis protein